MIIIGFMFSFVVASLYGLVIAGLIVASIWLTRRRVADPGMPRYVLVQFALRAAALALLIAPVMLGVLYVPLTLVSADGTRTLGVVKPRMVEELSTAIGITIVGSSLLALAFTSVFYFVTRKPSHA